MKNIMRSRNNLKTRAVLLLAITSAAWASHPKIARELDDLPENSSADVIIQYKTTPTAVHQEKLSRLGAKFNTHLHNVKGEAVRLSPSALAALAADPDVAYISPDRPVSGMLDLSTAAVNASVAQQYGLDGTGVGVAVLDSGISTHDDLQGRIVYSAAFVSGGTTDAYGHGTHVAGIIASSGRDSTGSKDTRKFQGVAPGVDLINLRVLDQNGQGTDSSVIAGIQAAIQLKNKYNVRVINLSLGRPVYESYTLDPLCQAVEAAWKAGIVVVVAAGNDGRRNYKGTGGYGTITAPGNDPYVITVGAMKTNTTAAIGDDTIASYSSKGPTLFDHLVKPDLVAPGNRVVSLLASTSHLPQAYPQNKVTVNYYTTSPANAPSNKYYSLSGTSMATPMVSGAAALLIQQNSLLTPDQIKARLMKTAFKSFPASSVAIDSATKVSYTSQYDIFTVGAGYLDIGAALRNNELATGSAQSPMVILDPVQNTLHLVSSNGMVWGSTITWGTTIVWGTTVFQGPALDQSTGIIWGTNFIPGLNIVWGSGIIWGTTNVTTAEDGGILITGE